MKIAVVGHSIIHPRQYWFWEYINNRPDVEVLQIYPRLWGEQTREGGYKISGKTLTDYTFLGDAFTTIRKFNPDIIYSNTEHWQAQSYVSKSWAEKLDARLVYFFWENLKSRLILPQFYDADLIVCGNAECEDIVRPHATHTTVLPQVGIMTDRFNIMHNVHRTIDILFVGRDSPEKGTEYIEKLEAEFPNKVQRVSGMTYESMPYVYNSANMLVVPSLRTQNWMEQWPACIAEALLCGTPVVALATGSIKSNYHDLLGPLLIPEDYKTFRDVVEKFSTMWTEEEYQPFRCIISADCKGKYGHEVVAEKLINEFEVILSR